MDVRNGEKYIYFFRHGETNWNVKKIIGGQSKDAPIFFTENGFKEISYLNKIIKEKNIEAIFASDTKRARETAMIANGGFRIPITFHKELRSLNMGKYEGFLFKEFIKQSEIIEVFKNYDKPVPGGESVNQLIDRVNTFLTNIVYRYPYKKMAIIAHNATISNIKAFISGEDYIDIDRCVLLFENNTSKVIEAGYFSDFEYGYK